MIWQVKSGSYQTGWNWQMNWAIMDIPLQIGRNTITVTAKDTKALLEQRILTVNRQ